MRSSNGSRNGNSDTGSFLNPPLPPAEATDGGVMIDERELLLRLECLREAVKSMDRLQNFREMSNIVDAADIFYRFCTTGKTKPDTP